MRDDMDQFMGTGAASETKKPKFESKPERVTAGLPTTTDAPAPIAEALSVATGPLAMQQRYDRENDDARLARQLQAEENARANQYQ